MSRHDAAVADSLPTWVSPMLARSGRGMPVDLNHWAIEPKWDGWRCLARVDGRRVRLTSRWRNDLTTMFAELSELPSDIAATRVLLDGEVVALRPDGSQDFHALTGRRAAGVRLAFMAFDVLHVDGQDLLAEAYVERRR